MLRFELNKGGNKIKIEKVLKKLEKIIFEEFKKSGIISIALISGGKIKEYNKRYRKKDKTTDILTFVLNERDCLGEIVLSPADIKKRSVKSNKSIIETAIYLIIHGICHIFGFTHKGKNDTKTMEAKEKKIMKDLCPV